MIGVDERSVLGVAVDGDLFTRWRRWFAPPVQPFRVDRLHHRIATLVPPTRSHAAPPEVLDTFRVRDGAWAWFDEAGFDALHADARRALTAERRRILDGGPLPPWPSAPTDAIDELMLARITAGALPSRHDEVNTRVWGRAALWLPGAHDLAGTFAGGSGPNGFATVMAAAGTSGIAEEGIPGAAFEQWLADRARPIRGTARDADPGVVLVWVEDDEAAHAAVTIGGGWVLNKPTPQWFTPRTVSRVVDVVAAARRPGSRLRRFSLR